MRTEESDLEIPHCRIFALLELHVKALGFQIDGMPDWNLRKPTPVDRMILLRVSKIVSSASST
jgi:hypothetical protein